METLLALPAASGATVRRRVSRGLLVAFTLAAATLGLTEPRARSTGDFYEEPLQTLPDYLRLDQLPAKSFRQIAGEMRKSPEASADMDILAELLDLPEKPGAQALASVDKMIAAARANGANAALNLLNDVRDLFAGPAETAESAAYLRWRVMHAEWFGVSFRPAEAAKPGRAEDEPAQGGRKGAETDSELKRQLAKASPALKAHWIYLQGAELFLDHKVAASEPYFLKVSAQFPNHPRAEAALFMAARCQLWRARSPEYTQQEMKLVESERPKAKKLFDEFFARFPHGRLIGDALGWYGAFAYDAHDFGTALRCYVQQTQMRQHPELYASAAEMVEKTLSHLASEPRDHAFAEVAKFPEAAQALVYLVINTSESDNFDGKLDSVDQVRGWRKKVLPRIAAAIATEAKLYQDARWKPRYLAMLAYAASGAGQQEHALKLLDSAGDAARESDDLLLARGVVLHRAKRPAEAVDALRMLIEKFPKSPLAQGAPLRLGLALADAHQGGEAVLALGKLLEKLEAVEKAADKSRDAPDAGKKPEAADEKKPDAAGEKKPDETPDKETAEEPDENPILYGIDKNQVRALIDTLLNFAPVEELASAAQTPGLEPVLRLKLTEPIAQRLLAKEQFAEAKNYMTPAQWNLIAGPIEVLTKEAAAAKEPAARAAACRKLGDAWAAARGKLLTYPLDTDEMRHAVYRDYSAEADVRRAASAPFIGASGNFQLDLEERDELRHAFNWWIEASDAQAGTPRTAQALWRALKAMPQIADVSPFTYERAVARRWTDAAHRLHDRLLTECTDSVEAKRYAVAWDFPALKKKPPEEDTGPLHRGAAGEKLSGTEVLHIEERAEGRQGSETLTKAIEDLEERANSSSPERLSTEAEAFARRGRKLFAGAYDSRWVNLADDLALFFSEPDPGPEVRKRYVALRFSFLKKSAIGGGSFMDEQDKDDPDAALRKDILAALADAKTRPVADYFEFLNLAVIANHFVNVNLDSKDKNGDADSYRTRDYPLLAKSAQAFMEKYPRSRKREAAMLLHARAVFHATEGLVIRKFVTWPQSARWEGGYELSFSHQEAFDEKRVATSFDTYDRAYPHGRYAADIRGYRAAVALRLHDWKNALSLTIAQLDDHANPSLDEEAANRLCDVFAQIADERFRIDILDAVNDTPRARQWLTQYLASESDIHPLRYMKSWLRERLSHR